ncbi:MAG: nucleotidyltransferase domain-containing protein [Candidatus Aenigmatarchaeota archaeon]|nr:MAG: nucleotidyltransferase domain-containing protein [Candidatus Aenigmarchaeota archaeon]
MVAKKGSKRSAKKETLKPISPESGKAKKKMTKAEREFERQRQERIELAKKFTKKILDKYGPWIKSVIVWGSTVRGEFKKKSDLDFVILVDDTRDKLTDAQRVEMDDWIYDTGRKLDERIASQPVWTITEFVKMVRAFTPLAYELMKDGMPTYDTGFFLTHKRLLEMGEIAATPEASQRRWGDVPRRISRAKSAKLWLIAEDLYLAMIGAEEAVLMYMGRDIPHPMHAAGDMKKYLVEPGLIDSKYADYLDDVVKFRKAVEHREIKDVESSKIDPYIEKAEAFVAEMEKILRELEVRRKRSDIQRAYEVMIKASVAALKAVNKLPQDPKELPRAFKKHLTEPKLVNPFYEDVLDGVLFMRQKMNEKKVEDVSERYIALTTEYVRRFVGEVRRLYNDLGVNFEEATKRVDQEQVPDVNVKIAEKKEALAYKASAKKGDKEEEEEMQRKLAAAGQSKDKEIKKEEVKEHTSAR